MSFNGNESTVKIKKRKISLKIRKRTKEKLAEIKCALNSLKREEEKDNIY